MEITPLGDNAVTVRVVNDFDTDPDAAIQAVLRARDAIVSANIPEVEEVVTAFTSVAVLLRQNLHAVGSSLEDVSKKLRHALSSGAASSAAAMRTFEIPVCYDAEFAIDISDVASHAGLSSDAVIQLHAGAIYRVACIGFSPGFPYLHGLPAQLATPRRATPRTRVPAGSVAIGGVQTGIYPQESPGGWNVIGRTPIALFDATKASPSLLRAGDEVRFRSITREEFLDARE